MTYPTGNTPETDRRDRRSGRDGIAGVSWSWIVVAILAIVIVLLVGWWLWQGADGPVRETRSASIGTILEEPEALVDDRVVVSGRVERLLTENAMTLSNDFIEEELLVLTPPGAFVGPGGGVAAPGIAAPVEGDGMVAPFLEGQFVQVAGAVRTFDTDTMSVEYGLVLAPELFEPFEGEPSIITELFDIAVQAPQMAPPVEEEEVNVGAVLAEPELYAGQAMRLEGAFGEVISDNVFTLTGPDGEGQLIVVGEGTGGLEDVERGRLIHVEGTVLSFDAEALEFEGVILDPNIDFAALEGQPAVIPTAVDVLDPDEAEQPEAPVAEEPEEEPAEEEPAAPDEVPAVTPQAS